MWGGGVQIYPVTRACKNRRAPTLPWCLSHGTPPPSSSGCGRCQARAPAGPTGRLSTGLRHSAGRLGCRSERPGLGDRVPVVFRADQRAISLLPPPATWKGICFLIPLFQRPNKRTQLSDVAPNMRSWPSIYLEVRGSIMQTCPLKLVSGPNMPSWPASSSPGGIYYLSK